MPITQATHVLEAPTDVLTLAYSGQNTDSGDFYGFGPFTGTFKITSGTGKFQGAQGTLDFIAQGGPGIAGTLYMATPSPFVTAGMAFYHFFGTINQGNSQ